MLPALPDHLTPWFERVHSTSFEADVCRAIARFDPDILVAWNSRVRTDTKSPFRLRWRFRERWQLYRRRPPVPTFLATIDGAEYTYQTPVWQPIFTLEHHTTDIDGNPVKYAPMPLDWRVLHTLAAMDTTHNQVLPMKTVLAQQARQLDSAQADNLARVENETATFIADQVKHNQHALKDAIETQLRRQGYSP